jgi:hypothetical protein
MSPHPPSPPQANGSTPSHQTSWPLVQETANHFGVAADVACIALRQQDIYAGPTDRLPFAVVYEALYEAGTMPEPLTRVTV